MSELKKVTAEDITKAMFTCLGLANEADDAHDKDAVAIFDKMWNDLLVARQAIEKLDAASKLFIDTFKKVGIEFEEVTT